VQQGRKKGQSSGSHHNEDGSSRSINRTGFGLLWPHRHCTCSHRPRRVRMVQASAMERSKGDWPRTWSGTKGNSGRELSRRDGASLMHVCRGTADMAPSCCGRTEHTNAPSVISRPVFALQRRYRCQRSQSASPVQAGNGTLDFSVTPCRRTNTYQSDDRDRFATRQIAVKRFRASTV
jgi:hypothetical protein